MASHAATASAHFNETDPHGGTPHTHVIVPPITLKLILGALLFFTVLTVATAQLEVAIMNYFNILLPAWVNVAGAMLIATVKAVLVMAYFMQLRYDNPMNTIIMLFCFFAVGLFLMFTSIDLFTRDLVYKDKGTYVVAGGTYGGDKPLVAIRKEEWIAAWGPEKYAKLKEGLSHGKHGHGHAHDDHAHSAQQSRGAAAPSGALNTAAEKHDDHGHSHGEAKPAKDVHGDTPADSHGDGKH
jgi:cytochrome c oxidase subunit 4